MKYHRTSLFLAISFLFSGCAISSGLQTYDLPDQGFAKTDQGAELSVIQLTQENLPIIAAAQQNTRPVSQLFHKNQSIYKLSSGDVLSINLWAYPEITPPVQDISPIYPALRIYL